MRYIFFTSGLNAKIDLHFVIYREKWIDDLSNFSISILLLNFGKRNFIEANLYSFAFYATIAIRIEQLVPRDKLVYLRI